MTMRLRGKTLILWAVRDVLRHPLENLLIATALAMILAAVAVPLMLSQALTSTTAKVLADAPELVVRRVDPSGWAPIPAAAAVDYARKVPGVIRAEPRLWGLVVGPQGPLTLVGVDRKTAGAGGNAVFKLPAAGEALLGPGITPDAASGTLMLTGETSLTLKILEKLPPETSLALHDVVVVNAADAGALLGLEPGWASDLAVDVFHAQEADAILSDLAAAFPWPVRITTRSETNRIYASGASRRSGITAMAMIPAVISLCLLMAASVRERMGRRHEVGLLKALGWTTSDVVRFQIFRSVVIGLPGTAAGLLAAIGLEFSPGITWPGRLFFGWRTLPPALYLETTPAVWILPAVTGLVLLPFLTASLAAALTSAAVDPQEILEREN
jgi:hypothetical protein